VISVIIPAYNAEKQIPLCLDSLSNQSLPKDQYEVIVVDDGSTDRTKEIAGEYEAVRVIAQANQGPAAARNNGASQSKGDILLFTDADCVPTPNWLEEMLKPFSYPEVVGVQGAYRTNQKENVAKFAQAEIEQRYQRMARNERIDFVGSYAAAYRRTEFQRHGGFDTRFPIASGEDADLSYTLSKAGHKLVFNPDAIVYHQHPSSLRRYLKTKFYRGFWRIKLYRKHPQKTITDSYTLQSLKFQVLSIPLFVLFAALCLFNIAWALVLCAIICSFLLFSRHFLKFSEQKGWFQSIFSAGLLFLRAAFLFFGMVFGVMNELTGLPAKRNS
jgi:cellulose synthase/poly-beta-1,6-N-acetylglucosamine synthase-like glycosyltransferase